MMTRLFRRESIAAIAVGALLASAFTSTATAGARGGSGESRPTTIRIGALLDLSGDGKTLGLASKAALEVAAADFERESNGAVDIALDIRNTRENPATAVVQFLKLVDRGARVIVGPQTSGEVGALAEAGINRTNAIIISNGSTAASLAYPGDAVFRLVPDERVEAAATADLMAAQDQDTVVITHRSDPGNSGLATSLTTEMFVRRRNLRNGPSYPSGATDFTTTVRSLANAVTATNARAAVYLAGFGEVADYMEAAAENLALIGLKWYGGDGSAKSQAIIDNEVAAKFAATSGGFPSPLLTISPQAARAAKRVIARIERKSGQEADAFSLAAYDALMIGAKALEAAGPLSDAGALKFAFAVNAEGYDGITGPIDLNDAGDRATGPFAFWAVCKATKGYEWRTIGTWTPSAAPFEPATVETTSCDEAEAA